MHLHRLIIFASFALNQSRLWEGFSKKVFKGRASGEEN